MARSPRAASTIVALALVAAAGTATLLAGPLDPPAGPITSTYKTLTEVEPRIAVSAATTPGTATSVFRITQPGSYYLTGNLTGVSGKHGVEIASGGVTLDLNGFDLVGVPGSLDGVSITSSSVRNVAVTNGSVRSWGDKGVELAGVGNHVDRVRAQGNGGFGIGLANGALASECVAAQNTLGGFTGAFGCSFSACTAYGNTGDGFVTTNIGSVLTGCLAHSNGGAGFALGSGAGVVSCSASGNGGAGISTGITSVVSDCSVNLNSGNGIVVTNGCTVSNCSSRSNALDGIVCTANCTVRANTSSTNGNGGDGANIHALGNDNHIEGNNCTAADRGIDVDTVGNLIVRNVCSNNATNWDVVAGNIILVVNAVPAGAVLGNAGGASPGSTDPNANFTH